MPPCNLFDAILAEGKERTVLEAAYWATHMAESRVDGGIHGAGTRENRAILMPPCNLW
jgi:hypothetical protein